MSRNPALEAVTGPVRVVAQRHVEAGAVTGAVVLVAQGEEAGVTAVGTKAAGAPEPMQRDTIFRIASMSKPIVAAAALVLVEEGRLSLDEPVERWLPELARRRVLKRLDGPLEDTVPANRPISVLDLLTFRCGLGVLMARPGTYPIQRQIAELGLVGFGPPDPGAPLGPDEWMRRLGQLPLMAQPGETWIYTTGSAVLGVLISRLEGKPLAQVLEERIFAPLGMADSGFFVPPAKQCRLAAAYKPRPQGLTLTDGVTDSLWGRPPAFPAGDAGLVSTCDDFFKFSRSLAPAGGRGPLGAASIAAMTANQLTAAQRPPGDFILGADRGWGYGLGVQTAVSPEGVPVGAFGWDGGLGTTWRVDPGSGRTVIVLTQTAFTNPDPPSIHKDVWSAVFRPTEAS